jgi:SAM-dependent methyltransferase
MTSTYALPPAPLLTQQAAWLEPARRQLLRRAHITRRRRILDLGAGYGAVTPELVRWSGGQVIALDCEVNAMRVAKAAFEAALRVGAHAAFLPFKKSTFDLVFSQLTLMWVSPLAPALDHIQRILLPGGALVALEPDYEAMIEYPPDIAAKDLWCTGLTRAGADPVVGRKLPGLLAARGFDVHIALFDTLYAPHPSRLEFLQDLPFTEEERQRLDSITFEVTSRSQPWSQLAHLPFFLITAIKS